MPEQKPYFDRCLELAAQAFSLGEVPIGAVLVKDQKVIAEGYNQTETQGCFTAHAEILIIQQATQTLKTKYLNGCELFVNLEPCPMCRAALQLSRVNRVHFLLPSEKFGEKGAALHAIEIEPAHTEAFSEEREKSKQLLADFFEMKRRRS